MIATIFNVVAPVFVISGIGYLWFRANKPFDSKTIGGLVMTVGAPCLVFSSLTSMQIDPDAFAKIAAAALLTIVILVAICGLGLRAAGQNLRVYLPSLIHPNTGNMGLPLCLMAFGEPGLALSVAYYAVNSVSQYTLGLGLASGTTNPSQLLRQPVVWAMAAALTVNTLAVELPRFIVETTDILAGLVIPAMLLMLGTSLARLKLTNVRTTLLVSLARLVLGFGVGLGMIWLFEFDGVVAGVVLIQSTMPAAVFNVVFAEQFDNDPESVAAVILLSTTLSFATLPLLVAFALNLAA